MSQDHFDFIIIGGGSAGYAAARTAKEVNERVAIVDAAEELGGLCILKGCMPSKTLIHAAHVLHNAQRGAEFGLDIPSAKVDMKKLHARKLEIIKEFADYRQGQLESDRFTLIREHARFIDAKTIELSSGRKLTADRFMIATGSTIHTPPIDGLDSVPCWTSDEVLDLDFVPKKIIVLGGGAIACELAQFLSRIGSEVIQIQRSEHILSGFPDEAAEAIEKQFRNEGIQLYTGTQLQSVTHDGSEFTATFDSADGTQTVKASYLVNALGRKPNTQSLGLDTAGVTTKRSGHIECNEHQQTSNPIIYAGGDVAGPHEIVHIAIRQGETAARHATGRSVSPLGYDGMLMVVFTDPQIAIVGPSVEELKSRGITIASADYPFDDHGKSILMGEKVGYVRVHADAKTGQVLGAECVGPEGGELAHSMAVAVRLKAKVQDLIHVDWYHPTLAEIWSYPLEDIAEEISG